MRLVETGLDSVQKLANTTLGGGAVSLWGLDSVQKLANTTPEYIQEQGVHLTGSTCYKNNPQARATANAAIAWAHAWLEEGAR